MNNNRMLEITVGAFMALGLLALFFLSMQVSNLSAASSGGGYNVEARFDNIGSLKVRSPVTMAGVRVGRVSAIDFDRKTFEAVVTLHIDSDYEQAIPDDTFAKIFTAGLLGEQYIGLDAGGSPNFLAEGGKISLTQSALVLEEIIGQFLFSKAEEGGKVE
ncbi:MAG: outer membrane lipid asymmetry maintenance protein MlaD [Gammaproteobacteria bacterium]|nr:outer membrane lipid asymmetry maintenance protein MlaD [Gammaproteobacteria bacterium]MCP5417356.1 outer membrane lipid asymmetry maintenance protein MlaD [Chromatiaceae bacterium]